MAEADDSELLRRIATGDEACFGEFYGRHSSRIYSFLVRMVGRSGEADDVLQDVFWQVWRRAEKFDPQRGSPLTWLILIARSRALDRRRRLARTPKPMDDMPETVQENGVSVAVDRQERVDQARTALKNLPAEQRDAIQSAFFDGLTHSEIAERENLPLGTVKTRIRAGMTKLRDTLLTRERGSYA